LGKEEIVYGHGNNTRRAHDGFLACLLHSMWERVLITGGFLMSGGWDGFLAHFLLHDTWERIMVTRGNMLSGGWGWGGVMKAIGFISHCVGGMESQIIKIATP
jgi:hypothetical protein